MLIIGHPDIPFEPLHYVETVEEIAQTPPNATLWLGPLKKAKPLAKHCQKNRLAYGVMAESVNDALVANALHARYILCAFDLAEQVQPIAETYLFDAKILVPVSEEAEMEAVAQKGIDGVIFPQAITA